MIAVQRQIKLAEICAACQLADDGHNQIINKRSNNFAECAADDYADSHIYHIALYGKFLKFLNGFLQSHKNSSYAFYKIRFFQPQYNKKINFIQHNSKTFDKFL